LRHGKQQREQNKLHLLERLNLLHGEIKDAFAQVLPTETEAYGRVSAIRSNAIVRYYPTTHLLWKTTSPLC